MIEVESMDLRLLEYFLAVCEELHFTKAAEKLGISQPTLSQQIRILESRLGATLFYRVGKKIQMTQAGEVLQYHARRIFSEVHQIHMKMDEINLMQRGKITIGCSGNHLLLPSLATFQKKYSGIELSIIDIATDEIIEKTLNHEFEVGIVLLPINESQLEHKVLFKDEFTLVVSNEHPLAENEYIHIKDLSGHSLFLLQEKYLTRQYIDGYFKSLGLQIKPAVELSDMHSLLHMTILNQGITILPKSYLNTVDTRKIRQIPIIPSIPLKEVGIVYRKQKFMSSTIKEFIEHMLQSYQSV
ncbi:LysR family transcriptional regulator [Fictibacillus enclensis]|uniref:LysR family transcriptional regulator n=1 Tax=Fictibacillus enclensis TaxID=1017270 RepID=UPI0025A1A7FD|nr:LysR family transcriptional regulator [Fictibacillus enclensis]